MMYTIHMVHDVHVLRLAPNIILCTIHVCSTHLFQLQIVVTRVNKETGQSIESLYRILCPNTLVELPV